MSCSRGCGRSSGGRPATRPTTVEVGTLRLDPAARRAWRGETEIELSAKGFALLEAFMRRPGEVLSRGQLLDAAWELAFETRSNIVDVYVHYLRERIGSGTIETVRGVGYRLRRGRRVMSRLPIRLRLTLPFAVVMAIVLAATGFFIRQRVASTLLASVDQGLRGQAVEAATRVERGLSVLDRDAPGGSSVGQLIAADGRVRNSTPSRLPALVAGPDLRRVLAGHPMLRSGPIGTLTGQWRILAAPVKIAGSPASVVVATSLSPREETLDRLTREFLIGGPLALAIAILAGYGLAAAALAPVEAMRRRAASIGASTPGSRLPTPRGRDELSRLAETLNDMLARLQAAFEHERRFVDDASHELRSPLALLRTELELALRRPRSREELELAVRSAAEESLRLSRLAEDLLLFARFDQGRLPLDTEPVDALALLGDVATRYAKRAGEQGRQLRVEDSLAPRFEGDPARLEQALGNLVENALDYGAGEIVLSAHAGNGRVELHVTDEGPGVAAGFLPRAFDRFSRADEARARGGTGLGLAIVSLIATAHGGEAGLANRPGGGADAWISLPAAPMKP